MSPLPFGRPKISTAKYSYAMQAKRVDQRRRRHVQGIETAGWRLYAACCKGESSKCARCDLQPAANQLLGRNHVKVVAAGTRYPIPEGTDRPESVHPPWINRPVIPKLTNCYPY
eukprot:190945-Chlamydomonas_euryale.AAC.9